LAVLSAKKLLIFKLLILQVTTIESTQDFNMFFKKVPAFYYYLMLMNLTLPKLLQVLPQVPKLMI